MCFVLSDLIVIQLNLFCTHLDFHKLNNIVPLLSEADWDTDFGYQLNFFMNTFIGSEPSSFFMFIYITTHSP